MIIFKNKDVTCLMDYKNVGIHCDVIKNVFKGYYKTTIDILIEARIIETDRRALNAFIAACIENEDWTSLEAQTIEYGLSNSIKKLMPVEVCLNGDEYETEIINNKNIIPASRFKLKCHEQNPDGSNRLF